MTKKDLKAVIWKEGSFYVAKAVGIEIASQGKTKKEALKNLQEAIELLFEDEKVSMPNYFVPENPELTSLYA